VDLASDQISDFIYEKYLKPALENGRRMTVDTGVVSRALGEAHTSELIRRVLGSKEFRSAHRLSLASASNSGEGVVYTFRLNLRRAGSLVSDK